MKTPPARTLFFAHANGFPARCYEPMFHLLDPALQVDFIPVMGDALARPKNWQVFADEAIEAIEARHSQPVLGVGHSLGGVAIFLATRKRPDLFSGVVMLDPPLFSWTRRWLVVPFQLAGLADRVVPPAIKALRRKEHFASREEARKYFAGKTFFKQFTPQALDAYVEHGLVNSPDGVVLRVPKLQEAAIFAAMTTRIGTTRMTVPAHYVIPEGHSVLPPGHVPELKKKFASWQWHQLPGNHMFPLEFPQETAALLNRIALG